MNGYTQIIDESQRTGWNRDEWMRPQEHSLGCDCVGLAPQLMSKVTTKWQHPRFANDEGEKVKISFPVLRKV